MSNGTGASIRLIVADLDGTLLDSRHVVTPFTAAAIRQVTARGLWFTVATGKTFASTTDLLESFDIRIPVICSNGTEVYAPDGTQLYANPIPRTSAVEAVRMARQAGLTPVVYVGHGLAATIWDANVDELVAHHEPVPQVIPDLETALMRDLYPYKLILMHQDHDTVARFQVRLEASFAGRAQVVRSGLDSVVELLPLNASKAAALDFILHYLEIAPDEAMCIGDNFNDLDMIRRAGIGVAMGNAPEAVRAGADFTTETNDNDGVGLAIRRFLI
jgi:Cof subfamily protein (haloacid dehalogenase superfamily)